MPTRIIRCLLIACVMPVATVMASGGDSSAEALEIIAALGLRESESPISKVSGWAPGKVVVTAPPVFIGSVPDFRERMQAAAGDLELVFDDSGAFVPSAEQLSGADAYIGFCSEPVMAQADDELLWLHNYTVGMDRCAGLSEKQVNGRVFSNGKRLSGPSIADHAIAMMMSLARGLPAYHSAQLESRWDRSPARGVTFGEIQGKTLLVVGLGGIGTEVARRAHGLGMRVTATRRSSREGPDFVERVGLSSELLGLAAEADVVVNALPLTRETTGLFDEKFFATMPKGSIFLSVGRGKSTVTTDLVSALQSGHLYGAGLDVTEPEPLPETSPLWAMPNVIITPHVSAAGLDSVRRGAAIAVENLRRYVAGEALLNTVNMSAGY